MRQKIGIIGSGNVGANTAFFLAERDVADVQLFDIQEGLSAGKTLDMMEAASIRGYQTRLSGTDSLEDVLDAHVLILAAGEGRTKGIRREDLYVNNRKLLADLSMALKTYTGVCLVVTEPVDALTTLLVQECGLSANKVMGLGGILDTARLRHYISRELAISPENISSLVIGRHNNDMLPLQRYCRVSGIPLAELISETQWDTLVKRTKKAGDEIVDLAERSSAYYGPSAAASDLAEAIIRDNRRILSVSSVLQGQYHIQGVALSLPSVIGAEGIIKTLDPVLTDNEKTILESSAQAIRTLMAQ